LEEDFPTFFPKRQGLLPMKQSQSQQTFHASGQSKTRAPKTLSLDWMDLNQPRSLVMAKFTGDGKIRRLPNFLP
jgi:hypothetical protein